MYIIYILDKFNNEELEEKENINISKTMETKKYV